MPATFTEVGKMEFRFHNLGGGKIGEGYQSSGQANPRVQTEPDQPLWEQLLTTPAPRLLC